jgi:hypothetical protein
MRLFSFDTFSILKKVIKNQNLNFIFTTADEHPQQAGGQPDQDTGKKILRFQICLPT